MRNQLSIRRTVSAFCSLLGLLAGTHAFSAEAPNKVDQTASSAPKPVFNDEGFQVVGFDQLASFAYTPAELNPATPNVPPPAAPDQIPAKIKALDATKVMVTGFMLPVKMDQGLVTEFLLVKDPMMCCYGIMPKLNEWVVVRMIGKGVAPLMDVPISYQGKLKVGELYDNGYLTGIYLLEGEKQAGKAKG